MDEIGVFRGVLLLATDGSLGARRAGRMAIDLAARLDLELHVVNVAPPQSAYSAEGWLAMTDLVDPNLKSRLREQAELEARELLDAEVQNMAKSGGKVAGAHARVGRPDVEIVRLAEELDAGLLVLGSRGGGPFKRTMLGSVADSVVRHADCPVLVGRVKEPG